MHFSRSGVLFVCILLLVILSTIATACSNNIETSPPQVIATDIKQSQEIADIQTQTAPSTPEPAKTLTVCLGSEPKSLFLYADSSVAARIIRQAIYDGPIDIIEYQLSPVILKALPSLQGGNAYLDPVQVQPGEMIVDLYGDLMPLKENTIYRPSGCQDSSCAVSFVGEEPVEIDQLVVRFELLSGITWSDGEPLTSEDSVYSYKVAGDLRPRARVELIDRTASYHSIDESVVEWRGLPGFVDPDYQTNFFTPLPQHIWGDVNPEELLDANMASNIPIGWGPYVIDEWLINDHIALSKNPNYFRSKDGLPYFDSLIYRFIKDADQALADLKSGECDLLDESISSSIKQSILIELDKQEAISYFYTFGKAWEHIDFGVSSLDQEIPPYFQDSRVRKAIAYCIDRELIIDTLYPGDSTVLDSYLSLDHPLFYQEITRYSYDPLKAADLLNSAGWVDDDNDSSTTRVALGITNVPDGTPLKLNYVMSDEESNQIIADIIQESLAGCGIQVEVIQQPAETLFLPGPEGIVFGRRFSLAQYAWESTRLPPCFLFLSSEIPGYYPDSQKSWGGANASGFSDPDYDQACITALTSLPDWEQYRNAHFEAQRIFTDQLPSIPLFLHPLSLATRPDICGIELDASMLSLLWNIEQMDYGTECMN